MTGRPSFRSPPCRRPRREERRETRARAMEHRLHAGAADADDFGDLFVRGALRVGQPEHRAIARAQLRHRAREVQPPVGGDVDAIAPDRCGRVLVVRRVRRHDPAATEAVAREVRGDAEQVVPAMRLALERRARPQEPVVRVLQQVVGGVAVARHPLEVGPEHPRRAVVEPAKRLFVHLQRDVR